MPASCAKGVSEQNPRTLLPAASLRRCAQVSAAGQDYCLLTSAAELVVKIGPAVSIQRAEQLLGFPPQHKHPATPHRGILVIIALPGPELLIRQACVCQHNDGKVLSLLLVLLICLDSLLDGL